MFARPIDMEPGMVFLCRGSGLVRWAGVEHVESQFDGKHRVRVLVLGGPSFVVDRGALFPLVEGGGV